MKRQPTKWEIIFTNNVSDKGFMSNIYKELICQQSNYKQPNSKWAEELNRLFLQRRHTNDQKAQEKMSNLTNY